MLREGGNLELIHEIVPEFDRHSMIALLNLLIILKGHLMLSMHQDSVLGC